MLRLPCVACLWLAVAAGAAALAACNTGNRPASEPPPAEPSAEPLAATAPASEPAPTSEPAAVPGAAAPAAGVPAAAEDCGARKQGVEALLDDAARCTSDADCTTFMPSCPFGCDRPINRSADRAPVLAAIDAYNAACDRCMYRCRPLERPPACSAGRCVRVDVEPTPP